MAEKEYIEREAILDAIAEDYRKRTDEEESAALNIWDRIKKIPAADVVEVVRCKDCKHYFHYGKTSLLIDGKNVKAGWCQRRMRYDEEHRMLPCDFCSYGEKVDGKGDAE